jgi:hypothetical protein
MNALRVNHQLWTISAVSDARSLQNLYLIDISLSHQLILESVQNLVCPALQAFGINTNQNM